MTNNYIQFEKQKIGDMAKRQNTVGRFQLWKFLMFSRFGNNFKINVLGFLGLAPILYVLFNMVTLNLSSAASLPFTSFVGVGYPLVTDSLESAFVASQQIFLNFGVFMLPLAVFLSMFLTVPAQYAARNYIWSEGYFHFKHIGKAFKLNGLRRLVIGFITALITLLVTYLIYLLRNAIFFEGYSFVIILAIAGIAILSVFSILVTLYVMSISMTYKSTLIGAYLDAVKLTFKVLVQNLVMLVPTLFPVVLVYLTLTFMSMLLPLVFTAIIFMGISWMFITWESYAQFVFGLIEDSRVKTKKKNK